MTQPSPLPRRAIAVALAGLLATTAAIAVRPARAEPVVFHVSVGGSDRDPGTEERPWRTLGYGLTKVKAGQTLYVHGGTYRERIGCWTTSGVSACSPFKPDLRGTQGTASAPIRVVAVPGQRPVVLGVLWIKNAEYWVFDGINVKWDSERNSTSDPSVKILGGIGWRYRNAEIWGARSYANVFIGTGGSTTQPTGWRLTGNCIHHTYRAHSGFLDHNIYVSGSNGPGVIERNILFSAPAGDNIKVAAGGASSPQPKYVTIRYNSIYYGGQNIRVGHSTKSTRIERNILSKAMGKDWYPNVRGFGVTGTGNVALNNVGYAAKKFLFNDADSTTGIRSGGGNRFPLNPAFDSTSSCSGYHPRARAAQLYGRYAGVPVAGDWTHAGDADTPGWWAFGKWRLRDTNNSGDADRTLSFGRTTDKPVVGDWNGDGVDEPGVFRNGTWILQGLPAFTYGKAGDKPVVGDWNGDGIDTVGIVRGDDWRMRNLNTAGPTKYAFSFGRSSDVPVVGDWNGDGKDTAGLFRAGQWYLRSSNAGSSGSRSLSFGGGAHRPVVGDWDGDGDDTIGAVLGATWRLRNSNTDGPAHVGLKFDLV